ncbi:MAG: hypothetical protein ACOH1Y_16950 [Propionicimonas sp.]
MTTSPTSGHQAETSGQSWETPQQSWETSGQHWEQPAFDAGASRPFVTGPILLPVVTQIDLPAPTQEEQNLRTVRALLWPVAILIAIITGSWWPVLIVPIVLGAFLRRRVQELRRQRYAAAQLLR